MDIFERAGAPLLCSNWISKEQVNLMRVNPRLCRGDSRSLTYRAVFLSVWFVSRSKHTRTNEQWKTTRN